MKKQILTIAILAFVGSTTVISCGESKTTETKKEVATTQYYCPMKCEGDKTYSEKGSCPKCGMDLVEVD